MLKNSTLIDTVRSAYQKLLIKENIRMLKIRLKRTGKKGEPHYRVVVMEAHKARDSKAIEELGYYNPRTNPTTFDIDKERAAYWLSVGAQPTETVEQYFVKAGILKELKKGSTPSQQKPKKKAATEE